eukprot:976838-Rhodomonas_salina.1
MAAAKASTAMMQPIRSEVFHSCSRRTSEQRQEEGSLCTRAQGDGVDRNKRLRSRRWLTGISCLPYMQSGWKNIFVWQQRNCGVQKIQVSAQPSTRRCYSKCISTSYTARGRGKPHRTHHSQCDERGVEEPRAEMVEGLSDQTRDLLNALSGLDVVEQKTRRRVCSRLGSFATAERRHDAIPRRPPSPVMRRGTP